jgi:hypothetical protein
MKNLHIICTKMLLGFGRDLGIDMTREKDGKNNTKKSSKKGQKLQENGNYFLSIIVLVSSK